MAPPPVASFAQAWSHDACHLMTLGDAGGHVACVP